MKNVRFTLGISAAILIAFVASANQAGAQGKQGPYVTEAAARLSKLINDGNEDGYTLANNSFSIGGGWLKQSKKDWIPLFTVPLQAGKTYRFIAAGDKDAKDVDIEILDANNKVVAKDALADPTATVDYKCKTTGDHTVRIRLYASDENVPCVCLAIMMTKKK